jgi:aminoglycoside phosphotransferase family enzyme/predicted kinase
MESRALIDALSSPEAYPDRRCQVSMRQTHISWLFLTERFVYKLKKPVDFGFLDLTTLASRKRFCDEEMRLNRRLTPEVYLGVVEVKAHEGRIRLGGPGTTIDYAVQMRRLPEDRMLPTLLAEGRVTVDTMRRLARAEHVCLTEPIAIFDCIEFNHRFRYGDVAADVAFLAMDLEERGFPDLARTFVRAYGAYAEDAELPSVLDFYQCYRAFVRAKVACFRLDDPTVPAAEKRQAARAAARYLELAASYATRLRRPWLLLCCGLMGSGKSVLAGALAERAGLHVLSSDVIRKASAGVRPTTPIHMMYGEGLYAPERTETAYRQMFEQAESLLAGEHSVVLDASFIRQRHRLQARQLAARVGAEFCVVECWCPEEELRRRLEARVARGDSVSDGRWELLDRQRQTFEPLFDVSPAHHLKVDTTQVSDLVVEAVLRQVELC